MLLPFQERRFCFQNEVKGSLIDEIRSFFIEISREELQRMLSAMVETCLTSDGPSFDSPAERSELLLNMRKVEHLIELASWL